MNNPTASLFKGLDLVTMARRGDRVAFDELTARHHRRNISIAHGILRDYVEAHDQVQESYRTAFEHLDRFQGNADEFSGWLSGIVENTCAARLRAQRRARFLDVGKGDGEEFVKRPLADAVRHAARRLPRILREAIRLNDAS